MNIQKVYEQVGGSGDRMQMSYIYIYIYIYQATKLAWIKAECMLKKLSSCAVTTEPVSGAFDKISFMVCISFGSAQFPKWQLSMYTFPWTSFPFPHPTGPPVSLKQFFSFAGWAFIPAPCKPQTTLLPLYPHPLHSAP